MNPASTINHIRHTRSALARQLTELRNIRRILGASRVVDAHIDLLRTEARELPRLTRDSLLSFAAAASDAFGDLDGLEPGELPLGLAAECLGTAAAYRDAAAMLPR
jgi:hypothetical protein